MTPPKLSSPRFPTTQSATLPTLCLGLSLGILLAWMPTASAANPERRALGQYAGKYKGQLRNLLTRKTDTGTVSSFLPTSPSSARIPKGKRRFRVETEIAFRIIFFGQIKRISVRNKGAKVKYRGRIQGYTAFPGGGTITSPASGSFKAAARTRGNRDKLDGKLKVLDPAGNNTITARFVGKQ